MVIKTMKQLPVFTLYLFIVLSTAICISSAAQYSLEIYQVQKALKEHGYDPGKMDGLLGEATKAAIIRIQRDVGLPETGLLDEEVKAKLGLSSSVETVKENDKNDTPVSLHTIADKPNELSTSYKITVLYTIIR